MSKIDTLGGSSFLSCVCPSKIPMNDGVCTSCKKERLESPVKQSGEEICKCPDKRVTQIDGNGFKTCWRCNLPREQSGEKPPAQVSSRWIPKENEL